MLNGWICKLGKDDEEEIYRHKHHDHGDKKSRMVIFGVVKNVVLVDSINNIK